MKRSQVGFSILAATLVVLAFAITMQSGGPRTPMVAHETPETAAPSGLEPARMSAVPHRKPLSDVGGEPNAQDERSSGDSRPVLRCKVQDENGYPVAFASVVFRRSVDSGSSRRGEEGSPKTSVAGEVEMDVPGEPGRFLAFHDRYVTVMPCEFSPERPLETAVIVVGPLVTYRGEVKDASGAPVVGCVLSLVTDEAAQRRMLGDRDRSRALHWGTITTERGRFQLTGVGWSRGLRLEIDDPAYLPMSVDLPPFSRDELLFVLEERVNSLTLYGVVQEQDGARVPRALVVTDDGQTVRADDAGMFALDGARPRPRTLTAFRRGFRPGRATASPREGTWKEPFRVVLGGRALSIRGLVVDSEGHSVEGAYVWIADYTNLFVDGLSLDDRLFYSGPTSEEALVQGTHACKAVRSDSAGRFELNGLIDRTYRVCTLHSKSLLHVVVVAAPGENVVLRLPSAELETVEGRIVSLDGQPIPNVLVFLGRRLGPGLTSPIAGRGTESDAFGRFSFPGVVSDGAYLEFAGDHIPEADRIDVPPSCFVEVAMPALRRFRVNVDDPDFADSFSVIDGNGKALDMRSRVGNEVLVSPVLDLARGTSDIALVSERAATIRFYREGSLVLTTPLSLAGDGLNLVSIPR